MAQVIDDADNDCKIIPNPCKYINPRSLLTRLATLPCASNGSSLCWLNSSIAALAYIKNLRVWYSSNVANSGSPMFAIYNILRSVDSALESALAGNLPAALSKLNSIRDIQAYWAQSEFCWIPGSYQSASEYLIHRMPNAGFSGSDLYLLDYHEYTLCSNENCQYKVDKDHLDCPMFVSGAIGSIEKRLYGPITNKCEKCNLGRTCSYYTFHTSPDILFVKIDYGTNSLSDLRAVKALVNGNRLGLYHLSSIICYKQDIRHFITYVILEDNNFAMYFDDLKKEAIKVKFPPSDEFFSSAYLAIYELIRDRPEQLVSVPTSINVPCLASTSQPDLGDQNINEIINRIENTSISSCNDIDDLKTLVTYFPKMQTTATSQKQSNSAAAEAICNDQKQVKDFDNLSELIAYWPGHVEQASAATQGQSDGAGTINYRSGNEEKTGASQGQSDGAINSEQKANSNDLKQAKSVATIPKRSRKNPDRPYKSKSRNLKTEDKPLRPGANKRLLDEDSLLKIIGSYCCSKGCLQGFNYSLLLKQRKLNLEKTEIQLTEYIVSIMELYKRTDGSIHFKLPKSEDECCVKAFKKVYGIGEYKVLLL
jgi:hypothetical protein